METADLAPEIANMSKELKSFTTDVRTSLEKLDNQSREATARLLALEQAVVARRDFGPRNQASVEKAPRDAATGMPILGKSHKFADNLPERANGETLDLDVMWRGILTNRWPSRDCPERKALAESSPSGGGYTLPLPVAATFIDFARANSVCVAAGAQTLPIESSILRIPVLSADVAAAWKAENADITQTYPMLDKRDATPHMLAGLLYMSIELAEDSR